MDLESEPPSLWRKRLTRIGSFSAFSAIAATCLAATSVPAEDSSGALSWVWVLPAFLVGWAGAALFSVLDHSLFSLDPDEIRDLNRVRPAEGNLLRKLRRALDRTWFMLLAGSIFFNMLLVLSVGKAVTAIVDREGWREKVLAAFIAIFAALFLGDVLPGMAAARNLKRLAPASARILRVCQFLLAPLISVPLFIQRRLRRFGRSSFEERMKALETEKRLLGLIGFGEIDVTLEEEEREMLDHAIEFGEAMAKDIMTPRTRIFGIESDMPHVEALEELRRTPYSRVIVYRDSLDRIDGVLLVKRALLNPETDYHRFIIPPLYVPEDTYLLDLMAMMKRERCHLVIVLDEYGSTAGIVTMNNLLEELVGSPNHEEAPAEEAIHK